MTSALALPGRAWRSVLDYEPRWDRELADSLADVPHFDEVERAVRRALKQAGLL